MKIECWLSAALKPARAIKFHTRVSQVVSKGLQANCEWNNCKLNFSKSSWAITFLHRNQQRGLCFFPAFHEVREKEKSTFKVTLKCICAAYLPNSASSLIGTLSRTLVYPLKFLIAVQFDGFWLTVVWNIVLAFLQEAVVEVEKLTWGEYRAVKTIYGDK